MVQWRDGEVLHPRGEQGWHAQARIPGVRVGSGGLGALELELELRPGQLRHL